MASFSEIVSAFVSDRLNPANDKPNEYGLLVDVQLELEMSGIPIHCRRLFDFVTELQIGIRGSLAEIRVCCPSD